MDSVQKEQEFGRILAEVTRRAREAGGRITKEAVGEAFADFALNDGQKEQIHAYLRSRQIALDDEEKPSAELTEEESDTLAAYREAVAALPVYEGGELEALKLRAMAGEDEAIHRLIEHYLPLVLDIARLYTGQGVLMADLIGEGNVALTSAAGLLGAFTDAGEIEPALSAAVMDAMEDLITETGALRRQDKQAVRQVQEVADKAAEIAASYRRKVTVEELADETGWDIARITEAVRMSGGAIDDIGEWEGDK